jgi:hypothetical protein
MAVTFQHKIALRPGSVFCFGTISSIADEEGTLHRIVDLPKKKIFLKNLQESRSETGKGATSSAPSKDPFQQARSRGSFYPENSTVHLSDGSMDIDHKEKGSE